MSRPPRSSESSGLPPGGGPGAAMADPAISERYRVVETLLASDEDALYLCRRLDTGALVELRVISGKLGSDRLVSPAVRQQATVVGRVASQGSGIAAVFECERAANGELVLVMEHPAGLSLRDVLVRDGAFSRPRALKVAVEVAQGLERGHNFGLVHGGLRPENVVLVESERSVVLTQFGFDWLIQPRATGSGAPRTDASPYQAPEQAAGEATQQSDVYALAAILYEMLAGSPPPAGTGARRLDLDPLAKRRSDLSPKLLRLLARALDPEPARRPTDVSSLCNDLWVEADSKSSPQPPSFRIPISEWISQRGGQIAGLGAVAALGAAAAIWFGPSHPTSSDLVSRPVVPNTAREPAKPAAAPRPAPRPTESKAPIPDATPDGPIGAVAPVASEPSASAIAATPKPLPPAPPRIPFSGELSGRRNVRPAPVASPAPSTSSAPPQEPVAMPVEATQSAAPAQSAAPVQSTAPPVSASPAPVKTMLPPTSTTPPATSPVERVTPPSGLSQPAAPAPPPDKAALPAPKKVATPPPGAIAPTPSSAPASPPAPESVAVPAPAPPGKAVAPPPTAPPARTAPAEKVEAPTPATATESVKPPVAPTPSSPSPPAASRRAPAPATQAPTARPGSDTADDPGAIIDWLLDRGAPRR